MIKEIMLASALFSNNLQVYNINNSYAQYSGSIYSIDYDNGLDTIVIDLNSGDSYLCELTTFDDGSYTLLEANHIQNQENNYGALNFSYFINYLYSCFGFNSDTIWTESYMEMTFDFDLDGLVFDGNMNNNCYYTATLGSVAPYGPNTFYQVCTSYASADFNEYYAHTTHSVEFDSFMGGSFNSNLYLILTFHNLDISHYDTINFTISLSFDYLYFEIEGPLGMWRRTSDFENRYTNFIYDNYFKLQQDYEDLEYDYVQLEGDYDLVRHINEELLAENERLNSKHALSNVFELIRSSFNGIVDFLEIELMPNLTLGTVIFIPVVIGVIFFILKALVL